MSDKKSRISKNLVRNKSSQKSKRKKRRCLNLPLMVAGGDSEGKVVYIYPSGNSEDY